MGMQQRSYEWRENASVHGRTVVKGGMAQDTVYSHGPGLEGSYTLPWREALPGDYAELRAQSWVGRLIGWAKERARLSQLGFLRRLVVRAEWRGWRRLLRASPYLESGSRNE